MTNPNDAIGTNAAYGTRTSVNAFNDIAQIFSGRGLVSGFVVAPKSGMTVSVGGQAGTRDVAVAEDNLGNRDMVDNRLGSAVDITLAAASVSANRYSAIVAYINNPAQADDTTPDAPSVCGIIEVQGNSAGVSEAQIRSAITADGGTGSVAYYVVIATIYVGAGTTTITSANISQEWLSFQTEIEDGSITTAKIADGAVTQAKVDSSLEVGEVILDYVQASDSSSAITRSVALDWSKYRKIVFEAEYGTNDASTRYDEAILYDANNNTTSAQRTGVQMDNSTTVSGYRQDSDGGYLVTARVYGVGVVHLHATLTSIENQGSVGIFTDTEGIFQGRSHYYWNHFGGLYVDAATMKFICRSWTAGSRIKVVGYK